MGYFPHFIMAKGNTVLWQRGHYFYEITERAQPFNRIKTIMDSCETAVKEFKQIIGEAYVPNV